MKMNREEAVAVFEEIKVNYQADPDWGVYDGVFSRRNLTEILDAYATLLAPARPHHWPCTVRRRWRYGANGFSRWLFPSQQSRVP